jgi:hypothetical protein
LIEAARCDTTRNVLLVVTAGETEDVALELVAEDVGGDLLAHALLQDDVVLALVIDVEELLLAGGRVGDVPLPVGVSLDVMGDGGGRMVVETIESERGEGVKGLSDQSKRMITPQRLHNPFEPAVCSQSHRPRLKLAHWGRKNDPNGETRAPNKISKEDEGG